jgi:transcriptional regulator GlxA family with amidase domain
VPPPANLIARHFVLYARRPGYQSQFSPLLQAQGAADAPFAALIDWMQAHLDRPLDVPRLAQRAGLSDAASTAGPNATGAPAHFVETLRLDAAPRAARQRHAAQTIAGKVGLRSSARLGPGLRTPLRHGAVCFVRCMARREASHAAPPPPPSQYRFRVAAFHFRRSQPWR